MAQTLTNSGIRALLNKLVFGSAKTISAGTNASPAVFTSAAHGYSNGDVVIVGTATGLTNANGVQVITAVTTNTFELTGFVSGSIVNGNGTFGGTVTAQRVNSGLVPGDLGDLGEALMRTKYSALQDYNRAGETTIQTIFGQ